MWWVIGFVLMCDLGYLLERVAAGYEWNPIFRLIGMLACFGFGSAAVVKFCLVAVKMFIG